MTTLTTHENKSLINYDVTNLSLSSASSYVVQLVDTISKREYYLLKNNNEYIWEFEMDDATMFNQKEIEEEMINIKNNKFIKTSIYKNDLANSNFNSFLIIVTEMIMGDDIYQNNISF